ncbi:MAG: hypothetical protein NZ889_01895 [Candidatus Pacearchaeota archaeon]|nr:hypothetical protein [Candidatus Pacearchaeota archaeon]
MKKSGIAVLMLILFLIFIFFPATKAELSDEEKVQRAYSWLIEKTRNKWHLLSTKENVFALLALQENATLKQQGNSSLFRRSFSNATIRCWGKVNASSEKDCTLVETSLAKIVLDSFGMNTSKVENWILSKKKVQKGLYWYLQINTDRNSAAICEIYYLENSEKIFIINPDKTVELNGSSRCFEIQTPRVYWFKLKDTEECLKAEYSIKCWSENATYVTATFLYKKAPGDNKWYVSAQTSSGIPARQNEQPQDLEPRLKVPSYCLGETTCNYEGTLWATYAFFKQGKKEIANLFVPYLVVNKEENKGFFPSAFFSAIIGSPFDQEASNMQHRAGYWKIQKQDGGTIYGTLYNTALAKLMVVPADFEKAERWILSTYKTEENKGFFSDPAGGTESTTKIMENAFILWQFWPHLALGVRLECEERGASFKCREECEVNEIDEGPSGCPGGQTCCRLIGTGIEECQVKGGTCREECLQDETPLEFLCEEGICCVAYSQLDCEEDLNGTECEETQICSGDEVETFDKTRCCLGICVESDLQDKYCEEVGEKCDTDEVCIDDTREIIGFNTTKDTQRCCLGSCVLNQECEEIGEPCEGRECEGNIKKTLDTDECCIGICKEELKSCEELEGKICEAEEECTGTFVRSKEGSRCCIRGVCKKRGKFPFWIIILVAFAVGFFIYFFFVRKKPKEETKFEEKIFPFTRPTKPLPIKPEVSVKPITKEKFPLQIPKPTIEAPTPKKETKEKPKKEKTELEKTLQRLKRMMKK